MQSSAPKAALPRLAWAVYGSGMHTLAPCPGCARHIKVESARCPFCDVPVGALSPLGFDADAAPPRVRYAALALGATLALTDCRSSAPQVPQGTNTVDASTPIAPVYGGPPPMPDVPVPQPPPDVVTPRPPPGPAPAYGLPPRPRPAPVPRTTPDPITVQPLYGVPPSE